MLGLMVWVSWQRARQRAAAARHVSAALEEDEETEIALSGFLGTFSGSYRSSGSPALYINAAGALDAYESS
jgi:hypothetical protein